MAPTTTTARPFVPQGAGLADLRAAAADCTGCPLYEPASQTVFGAGPRSATIMLVGEQPGDQEDRAGAPFVGPAGRLLDKALAAAGIDRAACYLTNAVKHFKYKPAERGKRRIHQTPSRTEVVACRPWLLAELTVVHPGMVVLLGAVAAKSLLGSSFRLTEHRGELLELPTEIDGTALPGAHLVTTVHPSAVLRAEDRTTAFDGLVADLTVAANVRS
jgi:DNA polymerase